MDADNQKIGSALSTVVIENERIRVTEWRFPARGDDTGWHRHDFDYMVIPLFTGSLGIVGKTGERTTTQVQIGAPYFRRHGIEHNVFSDNSFECAFLEIEFLSK